MRDILPTALVALALLLAAACQPAQVAQARRVGCSVAAPACAVVAAVCAGGESAEPD